MNAQIAMAASAWSQKQPRVRRRLRNRDLLAPLVAVVVLMLSHALFGATQSMSALGASLGMMAAGMASVAIGGPRHVRPVMLIVGMAIWAFAAFGWAGPLQTAAPDLAVLMAAGAAWIVGFIAARQNRALDVAWTALIWTSLIYCMFFFFNNVADELAMGRSTGIQTSFTNPASAALMNGLFAVLGAGRVLHMIKRIDAESAAGSEVMSRVLREGLGGTLLMLFALTCLFVVASQSAIMITVGVMIAYAAWDLRKVIGNSDSGAIRILGWLAPQAALGLVAWGMTLAFLNQSGAPDGLAAVGASHITRLQAYFAAFLEQPLFGHGLGALPAVGDRIMTLHNANALLADGGARNFALEWLVETGVAGLSVLLAVLIAIHVHIARGMGNKRIPRTFLRLAIALGFLMLLHGVADSSLDLPSAVWFYALVLGAACGVVSAGRKQATEPRPE